MDWTFLRNCIYAEMLAGPGAPRRWPRAECSTNEGEGRTAYVSRADCAAAAAAVLTSDGHAGKAYDITGPEALSAHDLAALFAEIGGRPVEAVLLDDDAWVGAMVEHAGLPEPLARQLATFGIAARQRLRAVVSTSVRDLTGREPRTAREVLEAALRRRLRARERAGHSPAPTHPPRRDGRDRARAASAGPARRSGGGRRRGGRAAPG